MLFKKKKLLGLDVGSVSTKLVEVLNEKTGPLITAADEFRTPEQALNEGEIVDIDSTAAFLSETVRRHKWFGRKTVAAVGGLKVFIRQMKIPSMPQKELFTAVDWEAKKLLPFSGEELVKDFVLLGEDELDGKKVLSVLLAAAPKQMVVSYHKLCRKAGLVLAAVDIIPYALLRCFNFLSGTLESRAAPVGLLDIGAQYTHFVIVKGNRVLFSRAISVGGKNITGLFSELAATNREAAERTGVNEEEKANTGEFIPAFLDVGMRAGLEELVKEIRRSLDYYRVQEPGNLPDRVVISGGASVLPGLPDFFSSEMGIEFLPMEVPPESTAVAWNPRLAVATGLALRGVDLGAGWD